jgi:hypothetical protein
VREHLWPCFCWSSTAVASLWELLLSANIM